MKKTILTLALALTSLCTIAAQDIVALQPTTTTLTGNTAYKLQYQHPGILPLQVWEVQGFATNNNTQFVITNAVQIKNFTVSEITQVGTSGSEFIFTVNLPGATPRSLVRLSTKVTTLDVQPIESLYSEVLSLSFRPPAARVLKASQP